MKKYFVILILVLIVVISSLMSFVANYKQQRGEIEEFNLEFEKYQEQTTKGIDVATVINSAVDNNEKHEIEKDENEKYIDDNKYCVIVEVIMNSPSDPTKDMTIPMEIIYSSDMDSFVKHFSLSEFKCIEIGYNPIGRVNKIVFELEE